MGSKTETSKMPEFQQQFLEETVLPYATGIAEREFTPYEGERVAGMTPLQQQAMAGYGALDMGQDLYDQAASTYGDLANFQMQEMLAASAGAADVMDAARLADAERMAGVGAVQAARAPDQIAVDRLATTDIDPYLSPFTQAVIEAGQEDIERQRQLASENLAAQAQRAGAFGGSRQAVQEGILAGEAIRQAGLLSAKQRERAFSEALASGRFDIGNVQQARTLASQQQLQAETLGQQAREAAAAREQAARAGNMQAANQFAMQQANLEQEAARANQAALNARAEYNARLEQEARQANFGGQFQAADVRARGAAGLGQTAGQQLQSQLAGLGAQMQAGEAARGLEQARLDTAFGEFAREQDFPLTGLNALVSAAGGIPSGYGTTTTRDPMGTFGNLLSGFGALGTGFGGFGISDVRLKENIVSAGKISDVNFYRWDWNDKAKEIGVENYLTFGVMAQELEKSYPEYVIMGEDGYRRVNYIGLYAELGV